MDECRSWTRCSAARRWRRQYRCRRCRCHYYAAAAAERCLLHVASSQVGTPPRRPAAQSCTRCCYRRECRSPAPAAAAAAAAARDRMPARSHHHHHQQWCLRWQRPSWLQDEAAGDHSVAACRGLRSTCMGWSNMTQTVVVHQQAAAAGRTITCCVSTATHRSEQRLASVCR